MEQATYRVSRNPVARPDEPDPNSDSNPDPNSDSNPNSDSDGNPDADADADPDSDSDADPVTIAADSWTRVAWAIAGRFRGSPLETHDLC